MQPQIIISHLQQLTHGVLNLTIDQAQHIIELVQGVKNSPGPVARLSRWNENRHSWEFIRSQKTTQENIDTAIMAAIQETPVINVYMWECFNDAGQLEGKIFTIHNNTF
ncbi:MAG: hypothetical protein ABIQ88_02285 [Chitinophagaceae bacterium]